MEKCPAIKWAHFFYIYLKVMEGTYFEKKFTKICKNFDFKSLERSEKDYLVDMYNQVRSTQTCPKTLKSFEAMYPNATNYRFFSGEKPEGTSYGSHLINGVKYFLVWDHD